MKITAVFAWSIISVATPAWGDPVAVTVLGTQDVLAMMAKLPNECALYHDCPKSWGTANPGYDHLNDAQEIAEAVVAATIDDSNPWLRAAQAVVYAAFESVNKRCAVGDGGKSFGAWQLQKVSPEVACVPAKALPIWLRKVKQSEEDCGPGIYSLTEVASGNCTSPKGRRKVAKRAGLVAALVSR
jgi:hypothetical protein